MKLSLGQASKMTGVAKSTLSKAVKEGVISASREGKAKTSRLQIDVSELLRVYPAKRALVLDTKSKANISEHQQEQALNTSSVSIEHSGTPVDSVELAVLREREKHHESTKWHYEERIKDLKDQLSEAKEQAEDYKRRFLEADIKLIGVLQNITPSPTPESTEHFEQQSNTYEHPVNSDMVGSATPLSEDVIEPVKQTDPALNLAEGEPFILTADYLIEEDAFGEDDSGNIFGEGDFTEDNLFSSKSMLVAKTEELRSILNLLKKSR